MPILIVLSNFPDSETARRVSLALVEERLAACANILPAVESIYRWKGAVESASEVTVLLKTTPERYARLERRLKELHPYELPEIVAMAPAKGLPKYLDWVAESCQDETSCQKPPFLD